MIPFADTLTREPLSPRIEFERASKSLVKVTEKGTRISITPTSIAAQKNRTEIKVMNVGDPRTLCGYSFDVLLPASFKPCATYEIIGQMHAGQLADGRWPFPLIAMRHFPDDRVDFVYGLDDPLREYSKKHAFKRDVFHEIEWRVFWSTGADGWAEVWIDRKKVHRFEGPNLHGQGEGEPDFKLGLYRPNGGRSSTFIIVRDVTIVSVAL